MNAPSAQSAHVGIYRGGTLPARESAERGYRLNRLRWSRNGG